MKITIFAAIIAALVFAFNRIQSLENENARLKNNQDVLLVKNQKYKISDSLNACKLSELQFTLKEYKKYRAQDLQFIKQLKIKQSDLQKVISSQIETISGLSAKFSDSIRIDTATNIADTLKCFNYKSKWTDVSGCIDLKRDSINLQIRNRESLKIVETVMYKRFLGFLWKTNKIKKRQVDIISENPNTEIVNCNYISIKQ